MRSALLIRYIVDSIHAKLPGFQVVYRPHPRVVDDPRMKCKLHEIEGVEVWTEQDRTLDTAIREASFVVTYSSNSAVEVDW